jgi:ribosomal protein S18 acetylase RimI-like enzyme
MVAADCGRSVLGCHPVSELIDLVSLQLMDVPKITSFLDEVPLLRTLLMGFLTRDVGSGGALLSEGAVFGTPATGPLDAIVYRSRAGLTIPVLRAQHLEPEPAAAMWAALSPTGPLVVLGAEGHIAPLIAAARPTHEVAFDLVQHVMERDGVPVTAMGAGASPLQLRLAAPADLKDVVSLVADHQREEVGLDLDRSLSGGLARRLRDRIDRRWCVLGFLAGQPVVHVAASVCSREGAQLEAIYTVPTVRGQGYAAQALARLGDELAGQGAQRVSLVVSTGNEAASRLYTRLGLTIRGCVRFVRLVPRGASPVDTR